MLRSWALGTTLSFSNLAWFAIGALVVGYLVQRFTLLGRYAYVIGGNEELARLSGVPVNRYKVMLFTFAGLCSGLAGVLIAARTGYGTANVGAGTLFQVGPRLSSSAARPSPVAAAASCRRSSACCLSLRSVTA